MSLPETLRLEYLKALGIESYFPRVQLPGAPASALVGLAAAPEAQPAPVAAPVQEPAGAVPPTPAIRRTPGPAPETVAQEPAPAAAPAARTQIKEEVRLQLLCIRAGRDLAIINAMPHVGPKHLSAGHRALLVNLLQAFGIAGDDIQVEEKPFCWPMVTGLHVDNSRRAAASALVAYLQQKHSDWTFSRLLVMGENVVRPVFQSADDGQDAALPALDNGKWRLGHTRSLDELLQRPALKKEAWACIRALLA